MNHYDPKKAAQVWQRVQQRTEEAAVSPELNLQELIWGEQYCAAVYAQLARQLPGRSATILRQLFQQSQDHLACLKGVQFLLSGDVLSLSSIQAPRDPPGIALKKAYARESQLLRSTESLSIPKEYTPVFALLATEKRSHCKQLAILLGNLPPRTGI